MKEIEDFLMLRKGNRVRLYSDNTKSSFKEGVVSLGAYADSIIYVIFDNDTRVTPIDGFKLVKLVK